MLITNLSIQKMSPDDPRYPDALPPPKGPFTEVYRMECTTDDGQSLETAFFWGPNFPRGEPTPKNFAAMLQLFATVVSRIEQKAAA